MISQKITYTSVIAAIAIASIALVVGLSQTQSTTAQSAPIGNNVYVFAEGVNPQATFVFRDATVTYDFQLFTQIQGYGGGGRGNAPEFTLTRIAGNTPYLAKAVDESHTYTTRANLDFPYKEFDVRVDLMQAGESVKSLNYQRCNIINYKVDTRTDNEEAYTTGGKTGFAITEIYTFSCAGYQPSSPQYDQMKAEEQARKPYQ
jgi:hypothetical protein